MTFLAGDAERLGRLLATSGVSPADIRAMVHEPAFLSAVLDHVCGDETLLADFAAQAKHEPAEVDRARKLLAGGDWERDTA